MAACPRCGATVASYRAGLVDVNLLGVLAVQVSTPLDPIIVQPCGHLLLLAGEKTALITAVQAEQDTAWQAMAGQSTTVHAHLLERAAQSGYGGLVQRYRQAMDARDPAAPQLLETIKGLRGARR